MNAIFRHITIRLWLTALAGGLICMALLPWYQQILGFQAQLAMAVVVLAMSYGVIGWGMNRIGLALIKRQIAEAAVWQRAGSLPQAEAAFENAKGAFDSFYLSPAWRKKSALSLAARLARFYLSHTAAGKPFHPLIKAYLYHHPEDEAVAQVWMEHILRAELDLGEHHEVAARIGRALAASVGIQRLLMQVYLEGDRSDFEALQTYRRVWSLPGDLPDDLVLSLTRLLLANSCLNDWALQVYLKGYALGDPYCLEGIAACVKWLRTNAENRHDLATAEKILAGVDADQRKGLVQRFIPPAELERVPAGPGRKIPTEVVALKTRQAGTAMMGAGLGAINRCRQLARAAVDLWGRSAKQRYALAAVVLVGGIAILSVLAWHRMDGVEKAAAPSSVQATPVPVTDPFTIQVAAYLKPEDAQRFADQLKVQGLDAFWTKATSSQRTWYQVKVDHFATKGQARQYGEQLKSKGLIDDFYVANYKQYNPPKSKP